MLSAKENYEIGFWIYIHANAFNITPLATAITPFFERFRTGEKTSKISLTEKDQQAERILLLMHAHNFVKAAAQQSDDKDTQGKASEFLQKMQRGQTLKPSLGLFASAANSTKTQPVELSRKGKAESLDDNENSGRLKLH